MHGGYIVRMQMRLLKYGYNGIWGSKGVRGAEFFFFCLFFFLLFFLAICLALIGICNISPAPSAVTIVVLSGLQLYSCHRCC